MTDNSQQRPPSPLDIVESNHYSILALGQRQDQLEHNIMEKHAHLEAGMTALMQMIGEVKLAVQAPSKDASNPGVTEPVSDPPHHVPKEQAQPKPLHEPLFLADMKLSDVDKFRGDLTDFNRFKIKIKEFFDVQPNRFPTDTAKITYGGH